MIRLLAGLPFQRCPRVLAYALLAAVVTTALLAADGAYRWYHDADAQVAEPSTPEKSIQALEPATAETQPADLPSQARVPMPKREVVGIAEKPANQPGINSAPGQVPNPAVGAIPKPAVSAIPIPVPRPVAGTATGPVAGDAAPERTQPKSSPQSKPQQARRLPAKDATREGTPPRRPVQAATVPAPAAKPPAQAEKPNVYYERDSQLGFAPQLTKRTCNPATGQMPMQCYYPREGRERFPVKPLD